jgi:hypothetical protein
MAWSACPPRSAKAFRTAWNEAVLKARRGERVLAVVKELYI